MRRAGKIPALSFGSAVERTPRRSSPNVTPGYLIWQVTQRALSVLSAAMNGG